MRMSIDEALETLRNTNAYGTMDIAKGIILNHYANQKSVIEDIKAEIDNEINENNNELIRFGLFRALRIVDKHINGKEQK